MKKARVVRDAGSREDLARLLSMTACWATKVAESPTRQRQIRRARVFIPSSSVIVVHRRRMKNVTKNFLMVRVPGDAVTTGPGEG